MIELKLTPGNDYALVIYKTKSESLKSLISRCNNNLVRIKQLFMFTETAKEYPLTIHGPKFLLKNQKKKLTLSNLVAVGYWLRLDTDASCGRQFKDLFYCIDKKQMQKMKGTDVWKSAY